MKKVLIAVIVLLLLYIGSYAAVRQANAGVWEKDEHVYVLFPSAAVYYLYRPLAYVDAAATGMRFHIGPHR